MTIILQVSKEHYNVSNLNKITKNLGSVDFLIFVRNQGEGRGQVGMLEFEERPFRSL